MRASVGGVGGVLAWVTWWCACVGGVGGVLAWVAWVVWVACYRGWRASVSDMATRVRWLVCQRG